MLQQQQQQTDLDSSRRPTLSNANLAAIQRNRNTQQVNPSINTTTAAPVIKRTSMQSTDLFIPVNVTYTQPPPQIQTQVKLENTYSLGILLN
jgi:hypothetical protein